VPQLEEDDIRAAVSAGILSEAQAAGLLALFRQRRGIRRHMAAEDEPFEFFRGFSEIFVTAGLALLLGGILAQMLIAGAGAAVPFVGLAATFALSFYFIRRRRMNLPGMLLAACFGIFLSAATLALATENTPDLVTLPRLVGLVGMAGMAAHFALFRLPFSMFVFGVFGWITTYAFITEDRLGLWRNLPESLFDLAGESSLASGSLIFGLAAFALGIFFDMRDPHRVSRWSATGFWLHVLAAPALVNTAAMTLYNRGDTTGYVLTAALLLVVTLLSLIIDRRSFMAAGLVYLGALIAVALGRDGSGAGNGIVATMLILGAFITALGSWWVRIRDWLMRNLPDFPLKDRLPPYSCSVVSATEDTR